jgi:hypothetical protein
MATKKTGARKSAKGKKKLTLQILSKNQREINGKLYNAIDLILDHLSGVTSKDKISLIDQAKKMVDDAPGFDPPGCNKGPGGLG